MRKPKATKQKLWQANLRETGLLLREFRQPVLIFSIAIIGLGILYHFLAIQSGEPLYSLAESIYLMLTLAFLQPNGNFPHTPILQVFYFLLPIIGVGTLAQGLAEFGVMLFNRRARSKEWEAAVASTFRNHTVLVGLGHLGFRVIEKLHEMKEQVVAVEQNPSKDTFSSVQKMNIPVIQDDATRILALENAGVASAKTIILCTQNDALNLQIALKARSINPKIQVVIRIFDEDFAQSLHDQFGFAALSGTGMAAPVFAAAAAGADVTNPISVEGQQLSLARLTVKPESQFAGKTVGYVEDNYHLSLILIRHDHETDMHPTDNKILNSGDVLAVLGGPQELNTLMHENG
ncbi:MAG: potassium channel protein [Chloroflexi bacterium]|nr:potassium channel protein [Chloroflexota bacterium]MBI3339704.1 potassium channel protein [Chloroflexota bacterium]